jgi:hypothetical protein
MFVLKRWQETKETLLMGSKNHVAEMYNAERQAEFIPHSIHSDEDCH